MNNNSATIIQHPGPAAQQRIRSALGNVSVQTVRLCAGQVLMEAVAAHMTHLNCDSAVLVLDGVELGAFNFVLPSQAIDDEHVAWYSQKQTCARARLRHATATVGRRNGEWWLHCHALWDGGAGRGLGHLLPDEVVLGSDAMITLYAFSGGEFDVAFDPETAFTIFDVSGGRSVGNALIAKLAPHVDLRTAIMGLLEMAKFKRARVWGLGSLIGARFEAAEPMESAISEVLILPGAQWDGLLQLPVCCVDTDSRIYQGELLPDAGPALITFELMIVDATVLPQ